MKVLPMFYLLIGAASTCNAEPLTNIPLDDVSSSNSIELALVADEYLAASVVTNTSARYYHRVIALQNLAKNPHLHLDVLRILIHDPDLDIRIRAAEALEPVDTETAIRAAKQIIAELSSAGSDRMIRHSAGLRAAVMLARLNDPSGFEYVAARLSQNNLSADKFSALGCLPEFRRFPDLPASDVIIRYVEEILPLLEVEEQRKRVELHLSSAFNALYQLRAVEALPRMKQWEPTLPPKIKWILQYNMRGLESYANEDNPHAPAPKQGSYFNI